MSERTLKQIFINTTSTVLASLILMAFGSIAFVKSCERSSSVTDNRKSDGSGEYHTGTGITGAGTDIIRETGSGNGIGTDSETGVTGGREILPPPPPAVSYSGMMMRAWDYDFMKANSQQLPTQAPYYSVVSNSSSKEWCKAMLEQGRQKKNQLIAWKGFLKVDQAGEYSFALSGHDRNFAGILKINGRQVIKVNGSYYRGGKSADSYTTRLSPGYVEVEVYYYTNTRNVQVMDFSVIPPDGISRLLSPADFEYKKPE